MSIFSKNVMFSEVTGTVTLNSIPVKNAKINRYYQWAWNEREGIDTTSTDEKGNFHLPLIEVTPGLSGLFPHEPVITQKITIKYQESEYDAWLYTKHNYNENGELEGKLLSLNCELSRKFDNHITHYGICTIQ